MTGGIGGDDGQKEPFVEVYNKSSSAQLRERIFGHEAMF